jgi:hypothetical protein
MGGHVDGSSSRGCQPFQRQDKEGAEGSHTKTPETSPKQATTEEEARTPAHGKARVTGTPGKTGKDGRIVGIKVEEEENSPLQGVNLNKKFKGGGPQDQPLALNGLRFSSIGPSQILRMAQIHSWDQQVTSTRGKMPWNAS